MDHKYEKYVLTLALAGFLKLMCPFQSVYPENRDPLSAIPPPTKKVVTHFLKQNAKQQVHPAGYNAPRGACMCGGCTCDFVPRRVALTPAPWWAAIPHVPRALHPAPNDIEPPE
ncbi:hypothetical protein EVAR_80800_1 [Eumeta japonica]|uniref:Uncharacterized protein n=1 Tax=Eumeta variegata TaxID=151549 RepID=A0A4C1WF56_EUMVA|nr:hypothetical protein EVAR_80800_1 [Eumeta japonica]